MDLPSIAEQAERPYISTGHLPEAEMVQKLVSDAHAALQVEHRRQEFASLSGAGQGAERPVRRLRRRHQRTTSTRPETSTTNSRS